MPLKGEELDELLTGWLDDRLAESERQLLERALDSEPTVRKRLDELRQLKADLQVIAKHPPCRTRGEELASRVIRAAQARAIDEDLPESHHVSKGIARQRTPAVSASRSGWKRSSAYVGYAIVAAATLLLAVNNFSYNRPDDDSSRVVQGSNGALSLDRSERPGSPDNDRPFADEPQRPTVAYVGDESFSMTYALVVDIQATKQAIEENVLSEVLERAGIDVAQPIVADTGVEQALNETRMIVQPDAPGGGETIFYFLRAAPTDLDRALQRIWADRLHFPNVGFDLAIDNPQSRLIEQIAKATGRRFAVTESFAAPLVSRDESGSVREEFPGEAKTPRYVSRTSRERGWGGSELTPQSGLNFGPRLASVLLVVRVLE